MPNTPDRGKQQPGSSEERKRQQLNDRSLEIADDDEATQVNSTPPGSIRSDREKAMDAGGKADRE
jgi:hypothetical protein